MFRFRSRSSLITVLLFQLLILISSSCVYEQYAWTGDKATEHGAKAQKKRIKELKRKAPNQRRFNRAYVFK